jgi:arylamine N-acetyltransferase
LPALRDLVLFANIPNFLTMKPELDPKKQTDAAGYFLKMHNIDDRKPSLEQVSTILNHFSSLPYENLSKIIKLNHNQDTHHFRMPGEILSDHKRFNLGGTCFSLTFLLKSVLDYLGYETCIIMADMRAGENSHCALALKQDGKEYLLDPGYLISKPLEISPSDTNFPVFLTHDSETDRFSVWTPSGKQVKLRYTFAKVPTDMEDFQGHWERSFHWMTMHGICLSKRDETGFIYLHNHYLKREGSDLTYKGKFQEEISAITKKYFNIPEEIVKKAESALRDNLHYDKELGYKVPEWIK